MKPISGELQHILHLPTFLSLPRSPRYMLVDCVNSFPSLGSTRYPTFIDPFIDLAYSHDSFRRAAKPPALADLVGQARIVSAIALFGQCENNKSYLSTPNIVN